MHGTRVEVSYPLAAAPLHLGRRSVDGGVRTRRPEEAHSGGDSGVPRASQHATLGEDGEETTTELPVGFDSSGEERSGGGARRRRRRRRVRAGDRRRGRGIFFVFLVRPLGFPITANKASSRGVVDSGAISGQRRDFIAKQPASTIIHCSYLQC